MHPAYSIIFFTTASGAGYGLFFWLGLLGGAGYLPPRFWLGSFGFGLGALLIAFGLFASTYHLGRPERALRAFTQWRSSWLSREAILAMASFLPALFCAYLWIVEERGFGWVGLILAFFAAATVFSTAMIYASLKPIPRWRNPWVVPAYLLLGSTSGLLLLNGLAPINGIDSALLTGLALGHLALGAFVKIGYWRSIDRRPEELAAASAIGQKEAKAIRSLTQPHTEENYLLREMGYRIARKHSQRLRRWALGLGFLAPAILIGAALMAPGNLALAAPIAAILCHALGLLVERWLFFAEAKHSVMLYYGAAKV